MHQVCSCVCVCVSPRVPLQSGAQRRQTPGKARCNLTSRLVFFSLPPFPPFCPLPFSFSPLFAEELTEQQQQQQWRQHFLVGCVGGRFQPAWLVLEFGALRSAAVSRRLSAHTHTQWCNQQPHAQPKHSVSLYLSLSLSPPLWEWSTRCLRLCCRGLPPVSDLSHTYARSILIMMWEVRTAFLYCLALLSVCLLQFQQHCTTFACFVCVGLGVVQCVWAVFDFIGCLCGELPFVMSRRSQTARHDGGNLSCVRKSCAAACAFGRKLPHPCATGYLFRQWQACNWLTVEPESTSPFLNPPS